MAQNWPAARRALIVEDEAVFAVGLAADMCALGFDTCDLAADGQEAFLLTMEDPPDIVLMDVNLEGGREGIEAARWLREVCDVPSTLSPETLIPKRSTESIGKCRTRRSCPSWSIVIGWPTPWRRSPRGSIDLENSGKVGFSFAPPIGQGGGGLVCVSTTRRNIPQFETIRRTNQGNRARIKKISFQLEPSPLTSHSAFRLGVPPGRMAWVTDCEGALNPLQVPKRPLFVAAPPSCAVVGCTIQ